jgi:predicted transcriptional regulator
LRKYTGKQVENIAQKFQALPEIEGSARSVTAKEAVKTLRKEIAILRKKGYSFEAIAEIMRGEGLDLSASTVKNYAKAPKRKSKPAPEKPAPGAQEAKKSGGGAQAAESQKKPKKKISKDTADI